MELLFRDDAYLRTCKATLTGVTESGGLLFDRTVFYATSGGQPGDTGTILFEDGSSARISNTITGNSKDEVIHVADAGFVAPAIGSAATVAIDWERRYALMKMHTACHLLSVVCPFPITGAGVNEDDSRVDFDVPDPTYTRGFVTEAIQKLVDENHPVTLQWIDEAELDADPNIVRSKNVRPPRGLGRLRLVVIGKDASVDSQPCGGTHVAFTGEIGPIHISKIEKKGKENRRFRIRFGEMMQ